MTDIDRAAIRERLAARHKPTDIGARYPRCWSCHYEWPCDAEQYRIELDAAEARAAALTAQRDRTRDLAVALEQDNGRLREWVVVLEREARYARDVFRSFNECKPHSLGMEQAVERLTAAIAAAAEPAGEAK